MKNKRARTVILTSLFFFAASLALLRGLNIYHVSIYNDIIYTDGFVNAVNIVHDILFLALYGFSVGCVFAVCRSFGKRSAWITAGVMIICKIADSVFSILWDITGGAIGADDAAKILTASEFAAFDAAILMLTYLAAIVSCSAFIKKEKNTEQSGAEAGKTKTGGYLIIPVAVMTVLQLISPIVSCIQFFAEYGAPTSVEAAQMAGDILLTVLKYGIAMYGFVFVTCKLFETVLYLKRSDEGEKADTQKNR